MEFESVSESESEHLNDLSALSDDFETEFNTGNEISGIEPYQFEPIASDEEVLDCTEQDEPNKENEDESQRLDSLDWCSCGNCGIMSTVEECVCCQEINVVEGKCEEDGLSCIVRHPGFEPVCLNPFVLETAYLQYRQQYGDTE